MAGIRTLAWRNSHALHSSPIRQTGGYHVAA